jgi:hypothetical protein
MKLETSANLQTNLQLHLQPFTDAPADPSARVCVCVRVH